MRRVGGHGRSLAQKKHVQPPPVVGIFPTIQATAAGPFTSAMTFLDNQVSASIKMGSQPTQVNSLSVYSSGFLKHALVSWVIPSAGSYAIAVAANPGGSLTPTNPTASVALTIGGTTYTAALPVFNAANVRFNGAICCEARYLVIPTTSGSVAHAWLSVIFDVRSYVGGKHRVDVCVASTRDTATTNTVTYNVTVTIGGVTSYSRGAMEHGAFMRWRHVGYVNLTEGAIVHDTSALETLKAVPTYISTMTSETYAFPLNSGGFLNGGQGYDKLRTGIISPNMGDTGGRQDIGLFPRWNALYLLYKTQNALDCTLKHGDLFGASWSTNITDTTGNPEALINLDTLPAWSTQNAAPSGPLNNSVGVGMSAVSQNPDTAHHAGALMLPWLLTGDRYYADSLAFYANWNMLHQPSGSQDNARKGATGLLANEQTRGMAWGLRTIAQAGKWLPDAHPFKAYFATKTQNNMNWLDGNLAYLWNGIAHPLGFLGVVTGEDSNIFSQGNTDGLDATKLAALAAAGYPNLTVMIIFSPWQYTMLATSMLYTRLLGYTGGLGVIDKLVGLLRELFNHDPALPFNHAMMFFPPLAYNTTTGQVLLPNWGGANSIHDLSAQWRGDQDLANPSSGGCPPFTDGGYGQFGRAALLLGKGRSLNNDAFLTQLMAYVESVTGSTMVNYVNGNGEWAFTPAFLGA